MYWANFLHMYQPPTQKPYWVKRVADESYSKIFAGLVERPDVKLTLNINAVLVELLDQNGYQQVIDNLRTLVERGQVELTASAKYHPLLPFLPKAEIIRQVRLNDATHAKYFGDAYQPKGFFPPEMAFSKEVAEVAAELGYSWIIADELSSPDTPDYGKRYTIEGTELGIYFRERRASWTILSGQIGTGKLLLESLAGRLGKQEYLLTAMDGETFGHHRPGLEQLLFEIIDHPRLPTVQISQLPELFPESEAVIPRPSTWALMDKDLERNAPFSRWRDPENEIHDLQWQLTELAIKHSRHSQQDPARPTEDALDKALHSDQYWWASARPWWSIEMIELGAKELYEAVADSGASRDVCQKAEKLYHDIVFTAFDWQRSGKVDELSKAEDEEIRQRTDSQIPLLPREEVNAMVAKLEEEMKSVAGRQEYERAAQIRNRISELKSYAADIDTPQPSAEGNREW